MGAPHATPSAVRSALRGPAPLVVFVAPSGHGTTAALAAAAELSAPPIVTVDGARAGALDDLRAAVGGPATVLVEDIDRVEVDGPEALATVVDHLLAGGARVVVTARCRPPLPLRRWQVSGRADVVTATGLVLDEAAMSQALGLRGTDLDRAVAVTRGWPSAVALLARHLRDRDLDAALAATREDHVAYLTDEALDVLAPDELHLLARASVFESLDPGVVEEVLGDPCTGPLLRAVAERTQLLAVEGDRYGWHPDVREALARRLQADAPGVHRALHLAAAEALGQDHRTVCARLQHLVAAEAWDDVLSLAAAGWPELLAPGGLDVLVRAIEDMPSDRVAHDVTYALGTGAVLLVRGHPRHAAAFLAMPPVRDDPAATATAHALSAHASWWAVPPDQAVDHVDQAIALLDAEPGRTLVPVPGFEPMTTGRTMLAVSRARALALRGDVADARRALAVLPDLPTDDLAATSVSAWATKALVDALVGDLPAAVAAVDTAVALADSGGWSGGPSVAPAHLARALVTVRSGSVDDVTADIDAAAAAAASHSAWALLRTTGAVAAMCGHSDRPLPGPDVEGHALVPLAHHLDGAWRARAALRRGDPLEAAALLAVVEPTELSLGPWAEVALATGDTAHVAATVAALGPPTTPAGTIVRSLVEAALAPPAAAPEQAARAAAEARVAGLAGVLSEAPHDVWPDLLRAEPDDATLAALAERVAHTTLSAMLSDREREVLRLLDGPLSVPQIGQQLFLSGHTAKWYVARVYRKLGVHSRAEAVARGRQLDLA